MGHKGRRFCLVTIALATLIAENRRVSAIESIGSVSGPTRGPCPCDCNGNGQVTIGEVILAVNITSRHARRGAALGEIRNDMGFTGGPANCAD
jgi:hypothetical protein